MTETLPSEPIGHSQRISRALIVSPLLSVLGVALFQFVQLPHVPAIAGTIVVYVAGPLAIAGIVVARISVLLRSYPRWLAIAGIVVGVLAIAFMVAETLAVFLIQGRD